MTIIKRTSASSFLAPAVRERCQVSRSHSGKNKRPKDERMLTFQTHSYSSNPPVVTLALLADVFPFSPPLGVPSSFFASPSPSSPSEISNSGGCSPLPNALPTPGRPFFSQRNFSVNRGPISCKAAFSGLRNAYRCLRKNKKSRWLCNVTTCLCGSGKKLRNGAHKGKNYEPNSLNEMRTFLEILEAVGIMSETCGQLYARDVLRNC